MVLRVLEYFKENFSCPLRIWRKVPEAKMGKSPIPPFTKDGPRKEMEKNKRKGTKPEGDENETGPYLSKDMISSFD